MSNVTRESLDLDAGDHEVVKGESAGPWVELVQQVLDEGWGEVVTHSAKGCKLIKAFKVCATNKLESNQSCNQLLSFM